MTCIKSGNIRREFKGPKGEPGVWYHWRGKTETNKTEEEEG